MTASAFNHISLQPCAHCRLPTVAPLLIKRSRSFFRGEANICLNCLSDAHRREDYFIAAVFLIPLLLLPVTFLWVNMPPLLAFVINLSFSVSLFLLIMVPFHEFAHLVVARLLGFDVPMLSIGGGHPFFTLNISSLRIVIGSGIGSGACWTINRSGVAPRWKRILVSLAGPLSNVLLGILAVFVIVMLAPYAEDNPLRAILAVVFVAGNAVYFLGSAVPRRYRGRAINDAANAIDHLRNTSAHRERIHASSWWIRIEKHLLNGNRQAARRDVDFARAELPNEFMLLERDISLAICEADWPHVQHVVRSRLNPPSDSDTFLRFVPSLILADLHTRSPDDLVEAQNYSQRLVEAQPRGPLALTLRAMVLCVLGQHEQGLTRLTVALGRPAYLDTHVLLHHVLAQIHDGLQSPQQAARHREHAAFYDPQHLLSSASVPPLLPSGLLEGRNELVR